MPPWLGFILVFLFAAAILVFLTSILMARRMLRPPRMTDGKAAWILKRLSPGDLGLTFENLVFQVQDDRDHKKLNVAAWWIPHPEARGRCAVLVHGYADAKVGVIAWAPTFHDLGWSILTPDLRAHGESDGQIATAGYFERHDLNQIINQLKAQRPKDTERIVLFGVSYGAAVVAATAALRDDIEAVILDCPFADYRTAAMSWADQFGLPGPPFQRLALKLAAKMARADFTSIRPADLIAQISCPLMVIEGRDDPMNSPADVAAIASAISQRQRNHLRTLHWKVLDGGHLTALPDNPQLYRQQIAAFLKDS